MSKTRSALIRYINNMTKKTFQAENIITISVGHMFHDIYTAFLAPMLPFLIDKFGISLFVAGFMDLSLRAPSLLNPFIGLVADKMSIRYCVIAAPGISAITMSLLGVAPFYPIALILLFVTGISSTFFHIPSPVMIKQISGGRTGTGMSFYMFGGETARTLGPLLITAAISLWGLEGSWRVMPLGIAASAVLYFKLKNIKISDKFHDGQKKTGIRKTIKQFLPLFMIIGGYILFRAGIKSGMVLYLAKYLNNNGASVWLQGIAISMLQLGGAAGTLLAGFISDKIGKTNTLFIAGIVNPILAWIFINSDNTIMIPILILMGFFLFAPGPVMLAFVQDTNSGRPSFINSVYMTVSFFLGSLMVLFVGFLGDTIGLELTFKICAALSVLSIPFIFLLRENERYTQQHYLRSGKYNNDKTL